MRARALLVLPLVAALAACSGSKGQAGADSASGDGGGDAGDAGDDGGDDTGPGARPMVISGVIRAQLYRENGNDVEFIAWEDSGYEGSFPFGAYFVGAITERTDQAGVYKYAGSTAVFDNLPEGSEYRIEVEDVPYGSEAFRLFAALDYWGDDIVHSDEPIGLHPDTFTLSPGQALTGMDITVVAPWADFQGRTSAETGGGRRDCTGLTVEGPIEVELGFSNVQGAVWIEDEDRVGPLDWAWFETTDQGDSVVSSYSLETCPDQGRMRLMGAIDSNFNGLIDPADLVGAYSRTPDVGSNPVTLASEDISDARVQIPLFDFEQGMNVVPFVTLTGAVGVGGGTFDDLPPGSTVYLAALKRRPQGRIETASLEGQVYDMATWEWPDLQGQGTVPFDLTVPANTLMYLWAFADTDGNGQINEAGEPVASGGVDDNGRLTTGTAGSAQDLFLGYAPTR